jgi:hypothetical protein
MKKRIAMPPLDDERMRARFMKQIVPEPNSGCWLFDCAPGPQEYSRFCFDKKVYRAHRIAYALFISDVAEDIDVCHRCDFPPCVNPDHLFLGTSADNHADMKVKGRSTKGPGFFGESSPRSVLTNELVSKLRAEYARGGISQHALARKYGINRNTIESFLSRRTWRHLP